MKNNQRILDSIGKLDNSLIENALNFKPEDEKIRLAKSSSSRNVKRMISVAAAAAMCVVLAVTCFANSDSITAAIKSIFSREEELIDPYAAMIDGYTQNDGITMTVDKIAKDGDNYLIYIHLRNPSGFEPGYLFYEKIEIEQETIKGWETRCDIVGVGTKDPETALLAGTFWAEIETKTQDIDLFVKIPTGKELHDDWYESTKKNNLRLSVHDLTTIQIVDDGYGTPKCLDSYSGLLSVEFEFDEEKVEALPEKVSYPNTEFEVDGTKFVITEMRYSPLHLTVVVEDPNCEIIEAGGLHFFGTSKISWYWFCEEYQPTDLILIEDSKKLMNVAYENGLRDKQYSFYVKTAIDDADYICRIWYVNENGVYNPNKLRFTYEFSKPMYEDEIKEIGFEAYIYGIHL